MREFYEIAVPVEGQEVVYNEPLDNHLKWLMYNWNSAEVATGATEQEGREWWEFWKVDEARKRELLVIGRYLLEGLDDFVRIAHSQGGNTMGLKATILASVSSLYDTVITSAKMPWWVKPFGKSVKTLVINVVASLLIDFIIRRYETGSFV